MNLSTAGVILRNGDAGKLHYLVITHAFHVTLLMPSGADTLTHTPTFMDEMISRNQVQPHTYGLIFLHI